MQLSSSSCALYCQLSTDHLLTWENRIENSYPGVLTVTRMPFLYLSDGPPFSLVASTFQHSGCQVCPLTRWVLRRFTLTRFAGSGDAELGLHRQPSRSSKHLSREDIEFLRRFRRTFECIMARESSQPEGEREL